MGALDVWLKPCVRVRTEPGPVDDWGEAGEGVETRAPLAPCLFAPSGTSFALTAGVDSTLTEPMAFWPGIEVVDVVAGDVLEIAGDSWRVHERPQSWPLGFAVTLSGADQIGGP